jgi:hypothetical protein
MKWESSRETEDTTSSPTSPRRLARYARRVWRGYWQVFGLAGMAIRRMAFLLTHLPSFREKPVVVGRSFLLTAAGQFRFRTGFPLTFPWKRHQQAIHNIEYAIFHVNPNVVVLCKKVEVIENLN